MGRIVRLAPIALAIMFALSGAMASSAFAESEFLVKTGGKFPVNFTGEAGLFTLNSVKHSVECRDVRFAGEISSATLGDVQRDLLGCSTVGPFGEKAECQSGTTKGLILTPVYTWHVGKLVTLSNGKKDVLILLLVSTTKFKCNTAIESEVTVTGNLVGGLTEESEFNKFGSNQELEFKQSSNGKQELQTFEQGAESHSGLHLELSIEPTKEREEISIVNSWRMTTSETVELMA